MFNAPMKTRSAGAPMRAAALCALLLLVGVAPRPASATLVSENKSSLTLVYDQAPVACHYLLNLYNRDLAQQGYVDTRVHRVFQGFQWTRLKGQPPLLIPEAPTGVYLALFDVDNSGHAVPVVRYRYYIHAGAEGSEGLFILRRAPTDAETLRRELTDPTRRRLELRATLSGDSYTLRHLPRERVAPHVWAHPSIPRTLAVRPLRWQGTTYVSISAFAESGRIEVNHWFDRWVVIGRFRPNDTFKDVCYFKGNTSPPPQIGR